MSGADAFLGGAGGASASAFATAPGMSACYDAGMEFRIEKTLSSSGWQVHVAVALDRQETSELFLAGDKLISWPTDGMRSSGSGPMNRSNMFLSEMVARPDGLILTYDDAELAERTGKILEHQIRSALGG